MGTKKIILGFIVVLVLAYGGLQFYLWLEARKPQEAYAKYTDENDLILFEGIPPGKYDINYGKAGTSPKSPGESYGLPVQVEIV